MSIDFRSGSSSEEAKAWAESQNLDVRVPTNYQLFIDIDDEKSLDEFHRNYDVVDALFGIVDNVRTPSRGKPGGSHIVVTLANEVTPVERCLLQAILGSDRRREAHSLQRIIRLDPEPTLFFEKRVHD